MGSRYGGLKQMDPVGPSGETLLDYSVYDALESGFSRVVFVIRRDFEAEFREKVAGRFEDRTDVGCVFQQLNDLPHGFTVPEGRAKPWGTGHAIWCARSAVDGPFLAINADDFYGRAAISGVGGFLARQPAEGTDYCMAGYRLETTLSPGGDVSRGMCGVTENGLLSTVKEFTKIRRRDGLIVDEVTGKNFPGNERVSMNCWGFTPSVFCGLETLFTTFLTERGHGEKSEFYIPDAVSEMIGGGIATVRVLPVEGQWFGVTYREDRDAVMASLSTLVAHGAYPSPLWT